MHEIMGAVSAAGRAGYEIGRQIQVDRVINDWANYANGYRSQRNDAWRQIETSNIRLKNYQQQVEELQEQIASLKKKNLKLLDDLRRETNDKETYKKNLKVQIQKTADVITIAKTSERRVIDAMHQVEVLKKNSDVHRQELLVKLNLQTNRLTATWARLAGAERVLGRLVVELVERAPGLDLEMLDDKNRKTVLVKAWNEVVKSKARYEPLLSFTFAPLPI